MNREPGIPLTGLGPMVFLSRAQRQMFQHGVPIFMLHKVAAAPAAARDPFQYTRRGALASQLRRLAKHGYAPLSMDSLAAQDSRRGYVLTFDDGYASVFENALEELQRQKVSSTLYVVAGLIGRTNEWDRRRGEVEEKLIDASQMREWLAAGNLIGSHTLTHPNLKRLSVPQAREEISGSKKLLEDKFGIVVRHFAYPSGKYNPAVRDLVEEAGYETACGVAFGANPPSQPRLELLRISPHTAFQLLVKALHRSLRRLSPRRSTDPQQPAPDYVNLRG